jgi:hypothetical protein
MATYFQCADPSSDAMSKRSSAGEGHSDLVQFLGAESVAGATYRITALEVDWTLDLHMHNMMANL